MSERAETPTILQRKRVHEAAAVQHNAVQEGCDEHDAAAGQDQVDDVENATQVPEVERQTRPRKPPDAGCLKLKKIGPVMLKAGFMPIKDSVVMNMWDDMKQLKLRMTFGSVARILPYKSLQLLEMNESFNSFNSGEEKGELLVKVRDTFVNTEEDAIGDVRENYMMSETYPT